MDFRSGKTAKPLGCRAFLFGVLLIFAGAPAVFSNAAPQPTPETSKQIIKQAKKLERRGDLSGAESSIASALLSTPEDVSLKLALASVYLKQKRVLKAFDIAFPIARDDPKNAEAFAILGTVYLATGEFKIARTLLVNSITLDKKQALAWGSLGMLEFYENDIPESVANLQEATFRDPREPDYHFALAQVTARGERYKESAEAYRKFLSVAPKNDKERRDKIKGLIKFLSFLGSRNFIYGVGGEPETSVDVELINNRPIIEIKINKDKRPLRFVLDTGSGITVISEKTAREFKIKPVAAGGLARALGGGGKFDIVYGFLESVDVGEARIRNVPVYIRKFQDVGTKVDGFIGLSLISKYLTTLDYGKKKLILSIRDKADPEIADPRALSIPLKLTSSGFLSGNVTLPGVESDLYFIVDTGASVSVVSHTVAEMDEVKKHLQEERLRVIGAAGVTEGVPMLLLKDVQFGGFSRSELRAVALNLDIINEAAGFMQAGILGGNFLKDYRLIFDFKRSRITLVPHGDS